MQQRRGWGWILGASIALVGCSDSPLDPPMDEEDDGPPPVLTTVRFSGQVVPLADETLPALQVRVLGPTDTVTAPVAEDGSFDVVGNREVGEDAVLIVTGATETDTTHIPSLKSFAPDASTTDLTVLLLPRRFTVPTGRWAGNEVPVSMQWLLPPENAVAPDGDGLFYRAQMWWLEGNWPASGPAVPGKATWTQWWTTGAFPLAVYFERGVDTVEGEPLKDPTVQDSAKIWAALDDLEDRLGIDLFTPARKDDIPVDTTLWGAPEPRPNSVSIEILPRLTTGFPQIDGMAAALVACRPSDEAAMCGKDLAFGVAFLSDPEHGLDDQYKWLVQHEFVHAIGFGHSCFRPSVVTACIGPYPAVSLADYDLYEGPQLSGFFATDFDAAYVHLYGLIHARTVELLPDMGLLEALDGERVWLLRKAPLGRSMQCVWAANAGGCLPGG